MNRPGRVFSNGTEYEVFRYSFCDRCKKQVLRDDGFPAFSDEGGCEILDAMENARFDVSQFPSEKIRELTDKEGIVAWHCCSEFETDDEKVQQAYNDMVGRAENE